MRRAHRLAIVFSAVVLVGAVALVLRGLDAMGVFTDVTPLACGNASLVRGVTGAGDMQFDAPSNALFVSATDARLWPAHPSAKDGIYLLRPGDAAAPFKLPGTSAGFHPSGISLFRAPDGSLTLMAINQPANGNPAVDIFDVSDAATAKIALHERESIAGDLLVSPAGIVAVDKGRFYATNEHTSRTGIWLMLERTAMLARANVVYFDGADFRIVARDLRAPSGVGVSANGAHLYVAETTGREIRTFARTVFSGDLGPVSALPIASGRKRRPVRRGRAEAHRCARLSPRSRQARRVAGLQSRRRRARDSGVGEARLCRNGHRRRRRRPARTRPPADRLGTRCEDIELRVAGVTPATPPTFTMAGLCPCHPVARVCAR
jgi:arylesterase/paraoxonase